MKNYFVNIEHSARPEIVSVASYDEAQELYNEMMEAGTPASAYYEEDGKKYNAFTEEELEEVE